MDEKPTSTKPSKAPAYKKPNRNNTRLLTVAAVIALGLGAGVGGGALYGYFGPDQTVINRGITQDGNTAVSEEETNVASVVEKVSPSVVSIVTTAQTGSFGQSREGAGTGIVLSDDGYVMTNNHVIENSNNISVGTSDGETYDNVEVIGRDPSNDIAFLRISDASGLTPAELGTSTSITIGQRVIAIGNSLGQYQNTVTSGIISGTNRPVTASSGSSVESLSDLIQTDAAINPGNSGGPLVNSAGQVIGINTAVASGAEGIGFAIPITATRGLVESVLETGQVERAYLGVQYLAITPDVANEYELDVRNGAYIFADNSDPVVDGSPADRAGLQNGDIISKVGDIEVGPAGGVATLIGQYRPGETVQIKYLRDGQTRSANVTLGQFE